jgi:type IV pilus assembly protein PilC
MVSVGERTGNMEEMFESIAQYYEEEMDSTVEKLTAMLEPIMIVFMGGTIGFILVAMYMPMFQMGGAL